MYAFFGAGVVFGLKLSAESAQSSSAVPLPRSLALLRRPMHSWVALRDKSAACCHGEVHRGEATGPR